MVKKDLLFKLSLLLRHTDSVASLNSEVMYKARLRTLEGGCVSYKSPLSALSARPV